MLVFKFSFYCVAAFFNVKLVSRKFIFAVFVFYPEAMKCFSMQSRKMSYTMSRNQMPTSKQFYNLFFIELS